MTAQVESPPSPDDDRPRGAGLSRRSLLTLGGSAVAGAAVSASVIGGTRALAPEAPASVQTRAPDPLARTVTFRGIHQAGIATPPQQHLTLVAFDAPSGTASTQLQAVLRSWSDLARRLAEGKFANTGATDAAAIASGTPASSFTMTAGVGSSLVAAYGLERPAAFVDLPPFAGDALQPELCDGDLLLQLCADDPLYLAAAVRALTRAAAGVLSVRWQFSGFRGEAAGTSTVSPRNLMGQIDGTDNIAVNEQAIGGPVWISDGPAWSVGGSYLAIRRFRMNLDSWEQTPLAQQEHALGRHKASGAPLGGSRESDPLDLDAVDAAGAPLIPVDSHVRLSRPTEGAGEEMLRRSYSYTAGHGPAGEDSGLLFLAFHRDPRTSFIPVQQRLAERDSLNAFTTATASSLFAILPGVPGAEGFIGQHLFA